MASRTWNKFKAWWG